MLRKQILRGLVGRDKPRTPERSLPSYKEPTPETHRRLTREEEAELALKQTVFTAGTPLLLLTLFVLTIASVPLIQFVAELRAPRAGAWLPMFDVFKTLPSAAEVVAVRSLRGAWNLLPRAEELKSAEKALESDSVVSQWLLPPVQSLLVGKLRGGNEQVFLGRDGWLFYRPDVDYITGPSFLAAARLKQRSHATGIQPDPVKAIVQFRDQLAARGIDLVVMPVPVKPTLEGQMLANSARLGTPLQNAGFAEFKARLSAAGVRCFDPSTMLAERNGTSPLYLEADTHWRPQTMETVAQQLAAFTELPVAQSTVALQILEKEITALGDVARMLKLPASQQIYPPEKITIRQITAGNSLWRPSPEADVLVLGDSFANIFSLEALGWGESAGFVEHLSVALGGRPLDCILRNSDGAFATREMLAHQLARGRDRLAGKKLVIWEFATRELAFGNWKLLDLKLGRPAPARFFTPRAGEKLNVTGTVEAVSSVPRPGTVPYKDHIMAVHLANIAGAPGAEREGLQSIVYLSSMRDNVWTRAARLRPGDRISLRLQAWSDVAPLCEQINRSEIDEPDIQLEEPSWGDLAP